MKKYLFTFYICILFVAAPQKVFGQYSVDLQIFEPLPEVNFAAFMLVNNLSGAPRIFTVRINPKGKQVQLKGVIKWKENQSRPFETLYSFRTETFTSRDLTNDEIGNSDILIKDSETNDDLRDASLDKGKPSGFYILEVSILSEDGSSVLSEDIEELTFLNPSQTLSIRSPQAGSSHNIGSVLAEWDPVVGSQGYRVRANVRTSGSQSLEEAIESGNPLIDNDNVGNVTVVNLRQLLEREWLPGQEIVLQVSAIVEGPGGGSEYFSNIVNFYLDDPDSPFSEKLNKNILTILESLPDELLSNSELLEKLAEGDVEIVEIIREDGSKLSKLEIDELVKYLRDNPNAVISLQQNN